MRVVSFSASVRSLTGSPVGDYHRYRAKVAGLLLTSAITTLVPTQSWAQSVAACTTSSSTITCTSAGNSYTSGIGTLTNTVNDLTLIVQGGVIVNSATAHGIAIDNTDANNNIILDVYTGTFITASGSNRHGIYVDDAVDVTVSSGADITSDRRGIWVEDAAGEVVISSSGDISTISTLSNAYASGIYVTDAGITTITSTGDISTAGGRSRGIAVKRADGVTINSYGNITTTSGSTGGTSAGILASIIYGDVDVYSSGSIQTSGASSGIEVNTIQGSVEVTVSGEITAGKNYSALPTTSGASGVLVRDVDGDAEVNLLSGGTITTHGKSAHGIAVETVGYANTYIVSEGDISTGGDAAHGINVDDVYGNVTVDVSGSVVTTGVGSHGIYTTYVRSGGPINLDINVSGTVTAKGSGSDGIRVNYADTPVNVEISGDVMGGSGTGAGLRLDSYGSSTKNVTISGSLGAYSDIAIVEADDLENVTINNTGTITGTINLKGGIDVLNNNAGGTWILRNGSASATADFGGGTDSVVNAGTLQLASTGTTAKTGSLTNLDNFSNSGVVSLADGLVGDRLTISGNFESNGGSLRLDTVLDDGATPQSDMLMLTTATTGSGGSTNIYISNAGGVAGQTSGNGIQIIDVATSSSSDAFKLGQRVIGGIYEYELAQVGLDWYLQSSLFEDASEYPALAGGAILASQADVDFLHHRMQDLSWRVAGNTREIEPASWTGNTSTGTRLWINPLHSRQKIEAKSPYEQKISRLEAGVDGVVDFGTARLVMGAFAGLGVNEQDFTESNSTSTANAALAGGYIGYRNGGLYGNAIGKYERQWADFNGDSIGDPNVSYDIDIAGLSIQAGYRFGQEFYAQPHAGVAYWHASAVSFEDASGATIDIQSGDSFAAKLGTRFGATLFDTDVYVDAGVKHEFRGEMQAEVSGLTFTEELPGTVGTISAGFAFTAVEDQLLLSLESGYAKGSEAEEFTALGNLSIKF